MLDLNLHFFLGGEGEERGVYTVQGWGGRVIGGGTADGGPVSTGAEVLGIPGGARVLHQLQKAGGGAWAAARRRGGAGAHAGSPHCSSCS